METLKFWCYHAIPLVYDDSLSYYEVLCKVKDYINNIINDLSITNDEIQELRKDVDGIMSGTIDSYIEQYVSDWFTDNQPDLVSKIDNLMADMYRIEPLCQGNMVVVGDSWSTDTYGVSASNLWCAIVAKQLNCTLRNYSLSGMGYMTGTTHFIDRINAAANDTAFDNDDVEYVFIQGSLNDASYYNANPSDYATNVLACISRAKTVFPKARVIVMSAQNNISAVRLRTNMAYSQRLQAYSAGVGYISMIWTLLGIDYATSEEYNYHPTASGQHIIAGWVMSCINGMPLLIDRDFNIEANADFVDAGQSVIKLRDNVLYCEIAGRSVEGENAELHVEYNLLESLRYFTLYINGRTLSTEAQKMPYAAFSTTKITIRDDAVAGTVNNAWYTGIVSVLA